MGGRGASSGTSINRNKYGTQFYMLYQSGNIKFIKPIEDNTEELLETMTRGRVYALINSKNNIKSITYFDNENKRSKVIEIDHGHAGLKEHAHRGYERPKKDGNTLAAKLTAKEIEMVDRVKRIWEDYNK